MGSETADNLVSVTDGLSPQNSAWHVVDAKNIFAG